MFLARKSLQMETNMLVNSITVNLMAMEYLCRRVKWNGFTVDLCKAISIRYKNQIINNTVRKNIWTGTKIYDPYINDLDKDGSIWISTYQSSFIYTKNWKNQLNFKWPISNLTINL